MSRVLVPLLLLAAPTLAWADIDTPTDTGEEEEDGGCKCASTLTNPTSIVSLGLGVALLAGIRRKRG